MGKKLKPGKIASLLGIVPQTIHYHHKKGNLKRYPGSLYDIEEVKACLLQSGGSNGFAKNPAEKSMVALNWSLDQAKQAGEFEKHRADILLYEQSDILRIQRDLRRCLSKTAIKKLSESEKVNWYRTLGADFTTKYDKERLERGKSTENVELLVRVISELRREHVSSTGNNTP